MKILCDQMLIRLGRWLRAAGYDTLIIEKPMKDSEIFKLALSEERILLTRDIKMKELDPQDLYIICLRANSTKECALELSRNIKIDWLLKPFSRCLLCNNPLIETSQPDFTQVPLNIKIIKSLFWVCSQCGKVYWEGTHTQRMLSQLQIWKGTKEA